MRKHFGILVALLCALVTLAGDEPWKTKAYQEWNDTDINQVLQDSPWTIAFVKTTEKNETKVLTGSADRPTNSSPNMCKDDQQKTVPCTLPPIYLYDESTIANSYELRVTWTSSRTVRKALARRGVLHSKVSVPAADKFVAQSLEEYHLVLGGLTTLDQLNEETIRQTAHLKVQGSRKEIGASRVSLAMSGLWPAITIFFPKKGPDGSPTISDGNTSVDFECKLGKLKVKVTFDLRGMTDGQGPDL
jgi:hypothetical protein